MKRPAVPRSDSRTPRQHRNRANVVHQLYPRSGYATSDEGLSDYSDTDYDQPSRSARKSTSRSAKYRSTAMYSEAEDENIYAFPVQRKEPTRSTRKPYTRKDKRTEERQAPPQAQPMERDLSEPEEIPHSESMAEQNIATKRGKKGTRQYEYNPWQAIGDLKADISIKQLAQISPMVRQSLAHGLRDTKPTYSSVNAVEEPEQRTPAYTTGVIGNRVCSIIIDTGAGMCLMSKALLHCLGWKPDRASQMTLIVADGKKSPALGEISDISVKLGNADIATDMTITESETYDVILGNAFLEKI